MKIHFSVENDGKDANGLIVLIVLARLKYIPLPHIVYQFIFEQQ